MGQTENHEPKETTRRGALFERLYEKLGQRSGQRGFDAIMATTDLKPVWSPSRVAAMGLAGVVHLLTAAVAVLGILIVVRGWPYVCIVSGGLICLAVAWVLFPRPAKLPGHIASPAEFPTLYAIANRIAQEIGAKPVTGIVIDHHFSASFSQAGWRRSQIVTIGLPLFAALNSQEKIAVLAHELAHDVNGDPSRGLFVGSALQTLAQWYWLLQPDRRGRRTVRFHSWAYQLSDVIMEGLSILPYLFAFGLSHLLWHDMQRAEYLADLLATRVSGTDAMITGLRKAHSSNTFNLVTHELALGDSSRGLAAKMRQAIGEIAPRDVTAAEQLQALHDARLNTTHPPTANRILFLTAHS